MSTRNVSAFAPGYALTNWDLERLLPECPDLVVRPPLPWNRILERVKETLQNDHPRRQRMYGRTHCIIASATRHGLHWYVALFNCAERKARLIEPTNSLKWSSLLANDLRGAGFDVKVDLLSMQQEDDNWRCGYFCLHAVQAVCAAPGDWHDVTIPPFPEDGEEEVWRSLCRIEHDRLAEEKAQARRRQEELERAKEVRVQRFLAEQRPARPAKRARRRPPAAGADTTTDADAAEAPPNAADRQQPPTPDATPQPNPTPGTTTTTSPRPAPKPTPAPAPAPTTTATLAATPPVPRKRPRAPSPPAVSQLLDAAWLETNLVPGAAAEDLFAELDSDLLGVGGPGAGVGDSPGPKRPKADEFDWLYSDGDRTLRRPEVPPEVPGEARPAPSPRQNVDAMRQKLLELRRRKAAVEAKKATVVPASLPGTPQRTDAENGGATPARGPSEPPTSIPGSGAEEPERTEDQDPATAGPILAALAASSASLGTTPPKPASTTAASEAEAEPATEAPAATEPTATSSVEAMRARLRELMLRKRQLAAEKAAAEAEAQARAEAEAAAAAAAAEAQAEGEGEGEAGATAEPAGEDTEEGDGRAAGREPADGGEAAQDQGAGDLASGHPEADTGDGGADAGQPRAAAGDPAGEEAVPGDVAQEAEPRRRRGLTVEVDGVLVELDDEEGEGEAGEAGEAAEGAVAGVAADKRLLPATSRQDAGPPQPAEEVAPDPADGGDETCSVPLGVGTDGAGPVPEDSAPRPPPPAPSPAPPLGDITDPEELLSDLVAGPLRTSDFKPVDDGQPEPTMAADSADPSEQPHDEPTQE